MSEKAFKVAFTLKNPQMPPPVLMSADTLGSSCSSGKVMGDPVSIPPDMAGCWTMGLDTTPGRFGGIGFQRSFLRKTNMTFVKS